MTFQNGGKSAIRDLDRGERSKSDHSLTKFLKTPCVSRLRFHVFDHILLFSHLEKRFLERLRSKIMAVASKCFRLAVAILFVYIILRDRAIFLNAARWRLGTKKQGRARVCLQQKLLAIFAADEIRRDRRIKSLVCRGLKGKQFNPTVLGYAQTP